MKWERLFAVLELGRKFVIIDCLAKREPWTRNNELSLTCSSRAPSSEGYRVNFHFSRTRRTLIVFLCAATSARGGVENAISQG